MGCFYKILISQQQLILGYQTWNHINPQTKRFYLLEGYVNYFISMFMNINENNSNERRILEKLRDILTKLPISQLLTIVEYQHWYYINAKTKYFYLMVIIGKITIMTIHKLK